MLDHSTKFTGDLGRGDTVYIPQTLALRGGDAGIVVARPKGIHLTRRMDWYDLLFVREGILSVQENDTLFEVHAGQSLILLPNRLHRGTKEYPPGLRYFWIHFQMQPAANAEEAVLHVPQFTTVDRPDILTELLLRYIGDHEVKRFDPLSDRLQILMMLNEIAMPKSSKTQTGGSLALAGRAFAFIRENYRSRISPSDVADYVGCNPQYLSRIFRRAFDQTLIQAIHSTRIEYARRLLIETNMNVAEIARACGFTDHQYFYRVFHRQEGMTALAFRQLFARRHINAE